MGARSARWTSQVNEQNQRPASRRTVAVRIRALPCSTRRASFRVDSWVLIVPTLSIEPLPDAVHDGENKPAWTGVSLPWLRAKPPFLQREGEPLPGGLARTVREMLGAAPGIGL